MTHEIDTYRQTNIFEMTQKELIVFLYDSALKFLEEATLKMKLNDVVGRHRALDRARRIFLHLLSTLNLEAGGELAKRLSALYAYFVEKITMANATQNPREIHDIVPLISGIRDSWHKIDEEAEPKIPEVNSGRNSLPTISLEV